MIRNPVVAGQFYPADAKQLKALIRSFVDETADKHDVVGLVLPHAGYIYSGPVAVAAVSRMEPHDTFIVLGPNHTGRGKPFSIMAEGRWKTPLGEVEIDTELARKIMAASTHLEQDTAAHHAEHSIEVQLPILQYFNSNFKFVPIVLAQADIGVYREIGRAIAAAVKELKRDAVVIASSDMTHYEPQESARKKDTLAIAAMLELDEDKLVERVEEADISMCGYAPVAAMVAAAKELGAAAADLVMYRTSGDMTGDLSSVVGYAGIVLRRISPQVKLARDTVETYINKKKVIRPAELSSEMEGKAGVFVSIHKRGALRGCIGTIEPQQENIAEEIIVNAISAATRDPRFDPVRADELAELDYSVDVLTEPEPVSDKSSLNPKKYGAIVECGWRRGLLLPNLEGVESVDEQLSICCQKAGISPDEKMNLYRFEVKRYK